MNKRNFNNKRRHRLNNNLPSDSNSQNQDNGNTKGFWTTDFNQRSAPEQYKEDEAKSKTTLAMASSGKKIEEIHQALGKSVSKKDIEKIKIEIYDLHVRLEKEKDNWKLKGYIYALSVILTEMTLNGKILDIQPVTRINLNIVSGEKKYQTGSFVLIGSNILCTIVDIKNNGDQFQLNNFITKEDLPTLTNKKDITFPNPTLNSRDKLGYGNIKKTKVDLMKNDVISVIESSNMKELGQINPVSSLGRSLMLFKINDFNLKKFDYDITKIPSNLVTQLFKIYFKLFYEDVISINDMFIELNYLLDNRRNALNNFNNIIGDTSDMVNKCVDFFHNLFSDVKWCEYFLESLFGPLSGFIPPLKRKKFILDPFQIEVCDSISNKESFILVAPTSSGKSVLSTYVLHNSDDGLVVIVVPDDSDVLAWQFASKIESEIDDTYVPIMTGNYKSVLPVYTERNDKKYDNPQNESDNKKKCEELNIFDKISKCKAIVGTATEILNILPEIELKSKREIGYLIFDEIHTIDIDEGKDMEHISKIVGAMNKERKKINKSEIPFMGLSATVSNPEFLKDWYEKIGWSKVNVIKCTQRFFNLQLHTTNSEGDIIKINPLSMVSISDLIKDENGNAPISSKEIDFTAIDVWELYQKIKKYFSPEDNVFWNPNIRFNYILNQNRNRFIDKQIVDDIISIPSTLNQMFELEDVKEYGKILIEVLVEYANNSSSNSSAIDLVNSLKPPNIETHKNDNVFKLFKKLEADNKCPAIAFMVNPSSCLRYAQTMYTFLRETNEVNISNMNESAQEEKITKAEQKKAKQEEEKIQEDAKKKKDSENAKKGNKKICSATMKGSVNSSNRQSKSRRKDIVDKNIDFEGWLPAESSTFLGSRSDSDKKEYNEFFKSIVNNFNTKHIYESTNTQLFWLIDLLQFGVGVYVKGLAGSYLRLVQSLALQKKLKVVFSDKSLMFGVSMPFRTAIIFRDFYDTSKMPIDPMMFQQMGGRAGRRGEDTEGHIVISGYSWENICKLNVKNIPQLKGYKKNYLYTTTSCDYISDGRYGSNVLETNFLNKEDDPYRNTFFEASRKINFLVPINSDLLKYQRMMWRKRNTNDSCIIPFIMNHMVDYFKQSDPENENDQTEIAYFLCHFIHIRKSTKENSMSHLKGTFKVKGLIEKIYKDLEENGIVIDDKCIDNSIYRTISANKIQIETNDIVKISNFKDEFLLFAKTVIDIQHYCFYTAEPLLYCVMQPGKKKSRLDNMKKVSTLLGKLVTRLWWEYQLDPITLIHKNESTQINNNVFEDVFIELNDKSDSNTIQTKSDDLNVNLPIEFDIFKPNFFSENNIISKRIVGDGNCLFRAVSLAVYGSEDNHSSLRAEALNYINLNRETLEGFITSDENFDEYITRLRKDGEWAGEIEITALREIISKPIYVYSNYHKTITGLDINMNGEDLGNDIILLNYFKEIDNYDFKIGGHYDLFEGNITKDLIDRLKKVCTNESDTLSVSSVSETKVKLEEDLSTSESSDVSKSKGKGKKPNSKKKKNSSNDKKKYKN